MAPRVVHVPMLKRMAAAVLFALLCAPAALHAALYEFTLRGTVTGGFPQLLNLNIGDECTIRYVLDSTDTDPHPWVGRYFGTNAVITFPNITIIGDPSTGGNLTVKTGGPGQPELVAYQNDVMVPGYYGVQISFAFPDGTITTDALPLELPLSHAYVRYWDIHPTLQRILIGTITSYSSAEVPEPNAFSMVVLLVAGTCANRFRHHR